MIVGLCDDWDNHITLRNLSISTHDVHVMEWKRKYRSGDDGGECSSSRLSSQNWQVGSIGKC